MFGIGSQELLLIIVVALVLLGPSKLPGVMRSIGKAMATFKRVTSEVKSTFEEEVHREEVKQQQEEMAKRSEKLKNSSANDNISLNKDDSEEEKRLSDKN